MNKVELTKTVTNFIVGIGTQKIVYDIVKSHARPQNNIDVVTIYAGTLVVGNMAADASKKWTGAKIDEIVGWWKTNVTKD